MKVKQKILDSVNMPQKRVEIAIELRVGEQMVQYHMRVNKENGRMTKMDFLKAISKISGVPVNEILEDAVVVEKEPQS